MSTDAPEELFSDDDGVLYAEEVVPQHGILGFTLRELLIAGVWLVMFVTSFFSDGSGPALWAQGIAWLLPLGLPTAAVFLIVLRRFSPDGIRRVGSLGIDQFASATFTVGALWWVQVIWASITASVLNGSLGAVWVPWVQLAALLILVVLTVFATAIPHLRDDFRGRLVSLAHRNANPVRPVIARPRPERPAPIAAPVAGDAEAEIQLEDELIDDTTHDADQPSAGSIPVIAHASGGELGTAADVDDGYVPGYARSSRGEVVGNDIDNDEINALGLGDLATDAVETDAVETDDAATGDVERDQSQPFWALAPSERDVVDERGESLFQIGPHAWALVIEDRGGAYVVRHDDGRIGYLHDIADITRG